MVNMILGKLNEENDIATTNISPSTEEPFILSRLRREAMIQELSLQEKERSIDIQKKINSISSLECCIQKDVDYYIDYLKEQDKIMCMKIRGRKPSPFYNIGFITFDNTNNLKCNTTTSRCARGKNIFDMRYIFILIHHGLQFTCAVIYMEQMKIEYYDSLCFDNVTRQFVGTK
jgi:hypothetical protein